MLLAISFAAQGDAGNEETLVYALTKDSSLRKAHFLELCEANVLKKVRPAPELDGCLLYFHALRDGYVGAQKKVIHRAAIYYELGGDVPPAADLSVPHIHKSADMLDRKPYLSLRSHATLCMDAVPVQALLEDFYAYVQRARPVWPISYVFDEFAQTQYAGKCDGSELIQGAPKLSTEPTPVGVPKEAWHGTYKMVQPEGVPVDIDSSITFGDEGFSMQINGKPAVTGRYIREESSIELQPRWGQLPAEATHLLISSDSELRVAGSANLRFQRAPTP